MNGNLTEISKELNQLSLYKNMPGLIFITDQSVQPYPEHIIEKLPEGSIVILRDYEHENRYDLGQALHYLSKSRGLRFLVAGDVALALALEADGVHLPEYLINNASSIRKQNPDYFITVAAHSEETVKKATQYKIDAVLLAPIFPTQSHPETRANPSLTIGTEKLKLICKNNNIPIYGLGGINIDTAHNLYGTEVTGIAAISGF